MNNIDTLERKKIILVDDNITNLTLGKKVLKDRYDVFAVSSAAKLFMLIDAVVPDLILMDIEMPEIDGYTAMRKLKDDNKSFDIPVIFVSTRSDVDSEMEGLSLGAVDYISKPFFPPLLIKRIENHLMLREQKKQLKGYNDRLKEKVAIKSCQVLELQNAVLSTLADMVEYRDLSTGNHICASVKYLDVLLNGMKKRGFYEDEIDRCDSQFLLPSAQLHDVGKIAISDLILNKPGKLTEEEFNVMKTHAAIGVEVIERIEEQTSENEFLENAKIFAATHHEKWDGSGYPYGLKGTDIPLLGRLMAVADVYEALVSKRPYKEPISAEKAVNIIMEGRGSHFDPKLIDVFADVADSFKLIAMGAEEGGAHARQLLN